MLKNNEIVVYKNYCQFMNCSCGLVGGRVQKEPDFVWVWWVGEIEKRKEKMTELRKI